MATERRTAGWKRRVSDHMFQAMFMAMDEGAVSRNSRGEIVAVNPAAEKILGLAATEWIGRSAADFAQALNFIREDETPVPWELHPATLAVQTGMPQRNVLMGAHRPDGTLVWISVNAQPLVPDGESGPYEVVTTFRDVTERKRTEDALSFVAQRGWMDSDENFFDALVQYLGKTLSVEYVIIGRLTEDPSIVETVALYAKGTIVPNLRYSLKGAPCENVMGKRFCFYPQGVQQMFPEDGLLIEMSAESYSGLPLWDSAGQPIGLIAVLDGKPLRDEAQVSQILQFMATRAAAELERERNERILRQSEREFRSLAETIPDNVVRHDRQARALYMNPALLDNVAPEARAVLGESLTTTFPGNDSAARHQRVIEQVIATGTPAELEFKMPNPHGEMRIHHVSYVAERDENGEIVGALGIGRDITERKASERQLRQALELTQGVINAIPDLLFEVDRDGTYLNVWAQNPELLVAQKEVLLGKTVSDVLAPAAAEVALSAIREADEKGMSFGKVYRIDLPQGESWFELSVSKKPGSDVPCRYIVLSRDITGRKRMEQTVAAREQEFRSLAESSPDSIIRYDRDGRMRYLNLGLLGYFGLSAADVIGRLPREVWPDGRYAEIDRAIARAMEAGEATIVELCEADATGALGFHQIHVVPERDAAGQIIGTVAFGRKVTAIRETERKLRHFIENLPGMAYTFRLSPDGHASFPYVSPAIKELYGLDPDDVKDSMAPLHMLEHPDDRPRIETAIAESAQTMTPFRVEFRVCRPGQPLRWLDARSVPERRADGSIIWYGIMLDITERKLAKRYEEFRSHTLELLSGGASLPDLLEGIVQGVEQLKPDMICSILLLDSQGKHFCKGIGPSLPDSYNAGLEGLEIGIGVGSCGTAAATGERVIVDDIMTHPYWAPYKEQAANVGLAACWSEPIRSSSGQVLGTFAAYHREVHSPVEFDISVIEKSTHLVSIAIERRQAEEALRASEQEFRTLAENLPDTLIRYDREGRRTYVNPAMKRKFAITTEQLIGKTLPEANPTDMAMTEIYQRALEHTLATGERSELEVDIALPGGERRTGLCFIVAERAADGRISGAIAIARDITERKRNETELRALSARLTMTEERERQSLAQELHDNLGQLLAAIKIKLTTLAAGRLQPAVNQIVELVDQADQSARLITRELSPPILRILDLPSALEWLAEEMGQRYDITVHVSKEGCFQPLVDGVQAVLYRSARELLINVAKHAGVREARLGVMCDENRLMLVVSDDGCGFDAADFRNSSSGQRSFGLGSIYERMSNIGGEMDIDSSRGRGTMITLSMPRAVATKAALAS